MINFEITLRDIFEQNSFSNSDIAEAIAEYCAYKDSSNLYGELLLALLKDLSLAAIRFDYPELFEQIVREFTYTED